MTENLHDQFEYWKNVFGLGIITGQKEKKYTSFTVRPCKLDTLYSNIITMLLRTSL